LNDRKSLYIRLLSRFYDVMLIFYRSMVVHKFVIRSSVEEHLYKMTEELQQSGDLGSCELTFKHLRDLFEASSTNLTEM